MNYIKILTSTPELVSLLICISVLFILLIITSILLVVYRNTETVKSILWFPKEIMKLYSNKDSFFSKKRVEGGAAFLFSLIFTICYCIINIHKMTAAEQVFIISPWLLISGYNVSKTQEEKLKDN